MTARAAVAVALAVAAACGDGAAATTSDAGTVIDAGPERCARHEPADWLADYELEVLEKIAGAAEIEPGVTLTARASAGERAIARDYLEAELVRWGLEPERETYASGINLVARLPATVAGAASEKVILGAHYDGVPAGPAAADDGTGVALVVAAARHFAEASCREVELVFVLFDEEEKGLIGSRVFVAGLLEREEAIRAVHAFDMISFDGDEDGAVELWSASAPLVERYREAGRALDVPVREVEFEYSDHQAFVEAELPVAGVSEEYVSGDHTPHYHLATDTVANVDLEYLASITRLALRAIARDAGDQTN